MGIQHTGQLYGEEVDAVVQVVVGMAEEVVGPLWLVVVTHPQ